MHMIKDLVELQKIDLHLQEIEELLGDLPVKVEELKAEEGYLTTAAEKSRVRLKEIELELAKTELHITEVNEHVDKLKDQLFLVKTNKQYDAIMHEIDHLKTDLDNTETNEIELMEEKDVLSEKAKSQELNLESLRTDLSDRLKKLMTMISESADKKEELEQQRTEKARHIDSKILSQYQRVSAARDGVAIVSVQGNSCGGCGSFVPPQILAEIKTNETIRICDVCSRILYWEK